jgi:glycosyltransferase involved in cell wall biosynthesis
VSAPKVTIITPTWRRHSLLFTRCIPSVQAQSYPSVEHLVISDGPDPELKEALAQPWSDGWKGLWYHELPAHDDALHWGAPARLAGLELASGEFIGYCDDDDSLREGHCTLLAGALAEHPEAGFAVSRMVSHGPYGDLTIGDGELAAGNVGTPMVMHRRLVLEAATWATTGRFEDWDLAWAWMQAGIPYVRVQAETSDVYPSIFR